MTDYKKCKCTWDPDKNLINIKKHKISFREARTAFYDDNVLVLEDLKHSAYDETRLFAVGISDKSKLLVVCHCMRSVNTVRIISARLASEQWIELYEGVDY